MKIKWLILPLLLFCLGQLFPAPCGDVNSDGAITIVDALMTAQYYVGLNPQGFDPGAADVSGDGAVTIIDALQTAQYYVGLIVMLQGCTGPAPTPLITPTPAGSTSPPIPQFEKPRVIATTDGEVDDRSSMIRFLMYASDYDIAGIVQVNSEYQENGHSKERWIEAQLDAYEILLPTLRIHNPDYPDAGYLRSVIRVGNENSSDLSKPPPEMSTKNTAGAQLIIDRLLDNDPRPVHVLSWGGANTTASALYELKTGYTPEQFAYGVSRIRIYCIWYQDSGGGWIESNIKEAYINEAYRWDDVWDYGSTGDRRNPPEQRTYMTSAWLNENVKTGHGVLGAMYPQSYVSEGDTPSFLHLINNGLLSHLDYTLGGWGGRSAYDDPINMPNHVTDAAIKDDEDRGKLYWRWLIDAQNDFEARMDYCLAESYSGANHPPAANVSGGLVRSVASGTTVTLDGSPTSDPDGNSLSYTWWQYYDADSAVARVTINNNTARSGASFVVPHEPGKQVHIIFEARDNGSPPLKGYRRIIFNIH